MRRPAAEAAELPTTPVESTPLRPRRRRRRRGEEELIGPLAVLPVRDTVLFPHMVTPLFVMRERSVKAIEEAMARDRAIVVVAQRDPEVEDVGPNDLYDIGTEAVIGRMLKMPDGTTSVLVQGQRRARICDVTQWDPHIKAIAEPVALVVEKTTHIEAQMRAVLALFEKCVQLSHSLPNDAYVAAMNIDEPGWLADLIASTLELSVEQRQSVLAAIDPAERLEAVSILLSKELDILELENKIHTQVQQEVDKTQREYFLREQMKAIQTELGEADPITREIEELREKIETVGLPEAAKEKANKELDRLAAMPPVSPETGIIRAYVDWLVSLPWTERTDDQLDIKHAEKVLNENHYGLEKVKQRILEYMAVRQLSHKMRSPILCFVGPPGVGKTSLGKSIAQALGRKFARVSLGGIRDEAEIRGHRRTYVGAMPGRIVQTMRTAGTINPLFMMDEIDKVGMDFRGDPSSALLEVLDPEQNTAFSDHYLEVDYDLSQVLFITTANMLDPIVPALRDRMEVIELPGYIEEEKIHICKQFLVPKQLEENGLKPSQLRFSDAALRHIIREYTHEAGVRNLEREIGSICRKVAKEIVSGNKAPKSISETSLEKYLGPQKVFYGAAEEHDEVGVATGVAWTEAGGDLMPIEVTVMEGKGGLQLTGQLGEVMRESAQAAYSYIRSKAADLGIEGPFWENADIHIHVPAGAIPKDGPSAGITMCLAMTSALTRRPVSREVCMTGEITLRGRVLPVGGLREKILAAHRQGIRKFILPKKNQKDLTDIPKDVLREMSFIWVEEMDSVLSSALLAGPAGKPRRQPAAAKRQRPAAAAARSVQPLSTPTA
ncbi:MAG TPA: endopeptidase La [Chloroflexota bacterium]|nr:endopeptidase La [Chloroflexota bacterium]